MTTLPPFRLRGPRTPSVPVVLDSPHSGRHFPPDFDAAVPLEALREGEDCWIDELWGDAPALGATLLDACFARTYIDANRSPHDVDLELLAGAWPHRHEPSGKAAIGKALVWRTLDDGTPIYDRRLSVDEVEHRVASCLLPYQRELAALIDRTHARHGVVYHLNCHSMRSWGWADAGRSRRVERADIVLGDRDGTSCDTGFTEFVAAAFRDAGYEVRVNDPYKGVELVRAFSAPSAGRHSLQIEISKRVYMNEDTLERSDGFERLRTDLRRLLERVACYAREQTFRTQGALRP